VSNGKNPRPQSEGDNDEKSCSHRPRSIRLRQNQV
jgi:hypothetical protein